MYGSGNGGGKVLAAATTAAALPVTGTKNVVEIALAVAAGLTAWAALYMARARASR